MGLLARLKSDKKLQSEARDILTEMIRRELLNVSVAITDPSISLRCPVRDAIVRREATVPLNQSIATGCNLSTSDASQPGFNELRDVRFRAQS
jgi:hypothetical protein